MWLAVVKSLQALPPSVRRSGRAIFDAFDARWRLWRLARHIAALRATPDRAVDGARRLAAMRSAWGNVKWSADLGYLQAIVRRMLDTTGPVLECGSGLTTLVLGVLAERRRIDVLSLEQDQWWAAFVQSRLSHLNLTRVSLVHAPLSVHDDFLWFDVKGLKFPESFDLVICDGPAILGQAEPYQSAWRVGLLPVLRRQGVRIGEVLLDDVDDPRFGALRTRWERQQNFRTQIKQTATGAYLTARPDPAPY